MNANIATLVKVLQAEGVSYQSLHHTGNLIRLTNSNHIFANQLTPFNTHVQGLICTDKYFQEALLPRELYPRTIAYLDPHTASMYQKYVSFSSYQDIQEDIEKNFRFPMIIKANRLSMGHNVFLCHTSEDIKNAIACIYLDSKYYDYVLLAQEYIRIAKEYRVVYFKGSIRFIYLKDNSAARYQNNLSPLHWEGARAVDIDESQEIWDEASKICQIITNDVGLEYFGMDLAQTSDGQYVVIEINGGPGFSRYIDHCGDENVQQLYRVMLKSLQAIK